MSELSFYWHDYETFGRVPRRDRPSQFAGVRTDAELNEIGEPLMLFCQPAPDSLPDPESVLLTGITPQQALHQGVPEHAFAAAIERELAQDGTVGLGYNSIRFDDEVTRHLFWRCLIDPYAREWQNGCGRWDLLDVVRCCWALRPEGIEWPVHTAPEMAGRPSFKLEHLTAANGLAHEAAHDALSDVRATIALARLIKSKQPRLWDFCLKLRKKDAVAAEIGVGRPFVHLSGMYPVERGCLAVVWPLGMHPTNKNELIVWDLAHDPRALEGLDADTVRRRLFTRQTELDAAGQGEQRLPIKTIHLNKSPIVIGNLKTLGGAAERWGLDLPAAMAHAETAAALGAGGVFDALWPQVFVRPAPAEAPDVDEDLYGGFVGNDDRRTLQRLRALSPEKLASQRVAFNDARLDELLFRYRARNFPQTLNDEEQQRWEEHRAERLHHGRGGGLTLEAYFERIDQLAEAADTAGDERAQGLLEALYDYAEGIAPEL
ncbi:exonuclease I [beta proteobacterium AAP121]|nr:exonuclease I [beta proteobacterium AAP65]KPG00336.1 exonuclease I [beta proteobacterium AAP121]